MGLLLDQLPAYQKAFAKAERLAEERRDLPFSGVNLRLCGLEVRQLTGRHLLILTAARNPFLCGGRRQPEDIAQLLWILRADGSDDRERFLRKLARVKYGRAAEAIDRFLDEALADKPSSGGTRRGAIAGTYASIVHRIATAYGWTRDQVLDSPIAEIFQYLRLQALDDNPKAIVFYAGDKAGKAALFKWRKTKAGQRHMARELAKAAEAKKAKAIAAAKAKKKGGVIRRG